LVYEKKTWASKEIINLNELQGMENGISDAHILIAQAEAELNALPDFDTFMLKSVYDPDADNKVESAVIADGLKNDTVSKTYLDIVNEIDTDILTHKNDPAAHHVKYTDEEAQAAINADTDHGTTAQHNYRTDEEIRDISAAMLIAGTGVSLTSNDELDTVTIGLSGTSFTSSDRTKLDGIEVSATADQTGDEIVTAINSSSLKIDTDNLTIPAMGLTEAEQIKFDGIEVGATADQTGSEIVTAINSSSSIINPANIDRGNLSTIIERGFIGEVVIGDSLRIHIPRAGTIQSATLISSTKPIGTSLMVDIRKNGTNITNSIFSSDTPMILSTSATATNNAFIVNGILDSSQITLAANDILRVYVTQTGNAVDVSVCLELLF